jgi:pimeloyl-ACP methyl ester carboxylesterase
VGEELAAPIPGARLVLVDGAGHLPTLERPHATTLALRDWLGH